MIFLKLCFKGGEIYIDMDNDVVFEINFLNGEILF